MKTTIHISETQRAELQRLAEPFFEKQDCRDLERSIAEILRSKLPESSVHVIHIPHEPDLRARLIRMAIVIDGAVEGGLFFTLPKTDPA